MSGKKTPPKKVPEKKPAAQPAKPKNSTMPNLGTSSIDPKTWIIAALVLLVTGLVFSGVTKLQWTNWDDDEYVYENRAVMEGDYKWIFTNAVNNNYNPLPVAMHAWEWKQMTAKSVNGKVVNDKPLEEKAWFFHVNNLWMHLVCTALVFWLMTLLGLNPIWAGLAALMFGIHPLRVESVAWITERKDVMFGMFYVGALVAYIKYLNTKNMLLLVLCVALAVLSLLSKIQAVSLPLSMLAIDWYRGRKIDKWLILEKVPFFIGSLVIGVIGWNFLQKGQALDTTESFGIFDRVALGLSSYCVYINKSLVPFQTCTFYPYPKDVGVLHYLGIVGAVLIVVGAVLLHKISRETTFGLAFFSVNIVFLLQIVGAGSAYMADRFTYIAYIGLFFTMAMVAQRIVENRKALLPVVAGVAVVMLGINGYLSADYVKAWKNSDTIWSDVIKKFDRKVVLAYVNRGQYLRRQKQNDRAFADFNTAIELQPKYHLSYLNRGNIYFDRNDDPKALADYSKVIELVGPVNALHKDHKTVAGALTNRGAIYSRMGKRDLALADFAKALELYQDDPNTWKNRAITYFDMGDYQKAIDDFTAFLRFEPDQVGSINARGVCYMRLGKWQESLVEFNQAIQLTPNDGSLYANRAIAYANLNDKAKALQDVQKAQSLGQVIDPGFLQTLQQ